MTPGQRKRTFMQAVSNYRGTTRASRVSSLFGVSNSADILDDGLLVGVPNWQNLPANTDQIILTTRLSFLPSDQVYIAVVIQQALPALLQRLQVMRQIGAQQRAQGGPAPGDVHYSDDNNNVRVYMGNDGKLYIHNKTPDDDEENVPWNRLGQGLDVDEIVLAIYPPTPSVQRTFLVQYATDHLRRLAGRDKVHEIYPWPQQVQLPAAMRRMPDTVPVGDIQNHINNLGAYFAEGLVERYHVALNHQPEKHFTILTGVSGTGKTTLTEYYARAIHGIADTVTRDDAFFMCAVRPDWTDPTGVLGYHDVLTGKYIVPTFLEAVLYATANRHTPVFVCLDEMNIARPEFYLADVLSAMETPTKELRLYSTGLSLESDTGEPINPIVRLPSNLFITGTVNVDEFTQPLSDKVLDRANVIDLSTVNIGDYLQNRLVPHYQHLAASVASLTGLLSFLSTQLSPHGLGFGYRTAKEIVQYHEFASRTTQMTAYQIIDSQVMQKILVKLRGGERQRPMLNALRQQFNNYPESRRLVETLLQQLDDYDSFQAMR